MIGLGLGLTARGGGGGFTPASLFASGEAGAWYDPSDISTLYTDDGVTNVSSDGDLVYRMDDKSGNGNHLIQATEAARPVYKTSGGLHWLLFDGTDDFLGLGAALVTGANSFDVFDGLSVTAGNSTFAVVYGNADAVTTSSGWVRYMRNEDQNIFRASSFSINNNGPSITSPVVTTGRYSAGSQVLRVDGVQVVSATGAAMAISANVFQLGSVGGITTVFNGAIYQVIVREAVSTTDEVAAVESYIAGKTGVTL